jgi:hypothetical protein
VAQDAPHVIEASYVVIDGDAGTLNPAFQDDTGADGADVDPTGDVGTSTAGDENPTDTPGVLDNPVTDGPLDMDQIIFMWSAILGVLSTIGISLVNRLVPGITPDDTLKRAIVAAVFCIVVGVLDNLVRGTLNGPNLSASILVIFFSAIGFYQAWFKTSGAAARIEGRTTTEAAVLRVQ